jgi:hypothetical protein
MSPCEYTLAAAANLPPELLEALAHAPPKATRRKIAELLEQNGFPVSPRTLEAWPLPVEYFNGKAIVSTVKAFELAYAKLCASPVIMGGRRNAADSAKS